MPILDIPWEDSQYLRKSRKFNLVPRGGTLFFFAGSVVPQELRQYLTEDFSYARWIDDDLRLKAGGSLSPTRRGASVFKPREHQIEGAKCVYKWALSGQPGALIADSAGTGKTLMSLVSIAAIAKNRGFSPSKKAKLLIVCPKGVIPVWRQTLHNYAPATASCRVMVTNYQQLNKLLTSPEKSQQAKRKRTQNRRVAKGGKPTVDWDFIIFDEAHYLRNYPSSAMSMAASRIAQLNNPYVKGKSPFVLYATATPGASPLNFALMAPWLSRLLFPAATADDCTPDGWGDFLIKRGFAVKKGKLSYSWATAPWFGKDSDDPKEKAKYEQSQRAAKRSQREDAKKIGMALKSPSAPFLRRSPVDIAGWPEQQLIALPIELTHDKRPVYEQAWTVFRSFLRLPPKDQDPKAALVQRLRYRQKASLLKVDQMVDYVAEFVETGNQVFVALEFIESLERYAELLSAKGISAVEISGRNTKERETERLKFQTGKAKVALCTVPAGISLHAGETLPDGSFASKANRVTVIHDIRDLPLDNIQSLGRAHRDGVNSIAYIPYFEETVDEIVVNSFANKNANMSTMLGSSEEEAEALDQLLREAAERF